MAAETAVGAAAYSRRPAHRRRPVADRRRGRRDRRGLRRARAPGSPTGSRNPATGSIFPACSPHFCCSRWPALSSSWACRWYRILCYAAGTRVRLERKAEWPASSASRRESRRSGVRPSQAGHHQRPFRGFVLHQFENQRDLGRIAAAMSRAHPRHCRDRPDPCRSGDAVEISKARNHLQLRRWLRPRRFQLCARPQDRRHPHAGRAHGGDRRRRARPA